MSADAIQLLGPGASCPAPSAGATPTRSVGGSYRRTASLRSRCTMESGTLRAACTCFVAGEWQLAASAFLPVGSVPVSRVRLIGREVERETARAFLVDQALPLLTLTGPGGIGKTRLALAIAQEVEDSFADGIVWVDLAPLTDAAL